MVLSPNHAALSLATGKWPKYVCVCNAVTVIINCQRIAILRNNGSVLLVRIWFFIRPLPGRVEFRSRAPRPHLAFSIKYKYSIGTYDWPLYSTNKIYSLFLIISFFIDIKMANGGGWLRRAERPVSSIRLIRAGNDYEDSFSWQMLKFKLLMTLWW